MRLVTDHFIQKGSTGLPKWQIENVTRNYISANNKDVIGSLDFEKIEELIRRKELGGLPGTKVKNSPKGLSPERLRSFNELDNGLDSKNIDISLKNSNIAKLPALN